jgi:hypothetical protein
MSNKQLSEIQRKLQAPKGQTNAFGKYKYRSCEDILEAVKPLLAEIDASIVIHDEMVMLGDRFYVKASATITFGTYVVQAQAYAREPLTKKGMDEAQITGATSSYARKYALNGLLAIDDTKDADTKDNSDKPKAEVKLNQHSVALIEEAMTLDELLVAWDSIPKEERGQYTELKNKAKKRLS